jgi:hypothetical protein
VHFVGKNSKDPGCGGEPPFTTTTVCDKGPALFSGSVALVVVTGGGVIANPFRWNYPDQVLGSTTQVVVLSARLSRAPRGGILTVSHMRTRERAPQSLDERLRAHSLTGNSHEFAMQDFATVKTRTLLILAVLTGLAIIVAFALQILSDSRFLG